MKKFVKPFFSIKEEILEKNYAKYLVKPLERGFGITLGNVLRRTLLSSTPGSAVFAYRIPGLAVHEYVNVEGIVEPLVHVSLNLKKLLLKIDPSIIESDEKVILKIKKSKQGPITGQDIICPTGVEIINKDHLILNWAKNNEFKMEIFAKRSRGYISFQENLKEKTEHDMIIIDSNYSCIKKVAYYHNPIQVRGNINLEELIIEVQTNGSFSPNDVIGFASSVLIQYLELFKNLNETIEASELVSNEVEQKEEYLNNSIFDLNLTQRSENCLARSNIITIGDLINHTEIEIQNIRNLGRKSLREIKDKLYNLNLNFKKE